MSTGQRGERYSRSALTRSPISSIARMKRWNCSTLNCGPIDIVHSWGIMEVAKVSRSTFLDIVSCTAKVAIWRIVSQMYVF